MTLALLVMTLTALIAGVLDLRTRRIPNQLTGILVAFALVWQGLYGPIPFAICILTMLVVFAIGSALYAGGILGGGDVKLLTGCAGIVGPIHLVGFLLCTGIAGGLLALLVSFRGHQLLSVLRNTASTLMGSHTSEHLTLPYGVAIAMGSLAYDLFFTLGPHT